MGTTMLVLCLAPIINGLLDRRFCNADGLCNDNEDESRFYSDKRVDRLDQDQEQRLLLFNRAERRDAERFDRRDVERTDERLTDRRDERLTRQDRSAASDERRNIRERLFDRQDRDIDRNVNDNVERMIERSDYRSGDRRLSVEERRSRNDDRVERRERFDERRMRETRDRRNDGRREDLIRDSEREQRREMLNRVEDMAEERREREGRADERLGENVRMDRDSTNEERSDRSIGEYQQIRGQLRDENNRQDERRVRNEQRSEQERVNRSARRISEDRLDREREDRVEDRRETRKTTNDRYEVSRVDAERIVDKFGTNNYSTPFLWTIVQGALMAFIGYKIMKKNEMNGDWKPSKFTNLIKQRDTTISCN